MKVTYRERVYELSEAHISFRHALEIQRQTETSIGDWQAMLRYSREDNDGRRPPREWLTAWAALYWLMLAQNGDDADADEMDFDFTAFLDAYYEALSAEVKRLKAEPEPDPTPPSGTPDGPQSSAPSTPRATTRKPRARQGGPSTGSG